RKGVHYWKDTNPAAGNAANFTAAYAGRPFLVDEVMKNPAAIRRFTIRQLLSYCKDYYCLVKGLGGAAGSLAPFSLYQLQVATAPGAGGRVTGAGHFEAGTPAPITATPPAGHRFLDWQGAGVVDANAAATTVTMTAARNVTARFRKVWNLTLTVNPADSGDLTGA